MLRVLSFLVLTLLANVTLSADFPRGCEVKGFAYTENNLVLNDSGEQSFYLLQNRTDKPVGIRHLETRDEFMSPSLEIRLSPSNWAAFASDVQNMYLECYNPESETPTAVKCQEVLEICEYPRVRFALSNMGNYWVSFNKTREQVIQDAVAKGIWLRW